MLQRKRELGIGLAALALFATADTDRITAAGEGARVIAFKHIHTSETLSVVYKKDGKYVPEALEKINWIMRDWRKNQTQKMDPATIDLLWEMHTELGSAEPMQIICGYRSTETNEMLRRTVGGQASQSQHISGKAIDVTFPDVPLKKMRYAALVRERGGVGYYPTSGIPFVHVDTASVRHWPRLPRYELALLFPNGQTKYQPAEGGAISRDDVRVAREKHKDLAVQIAAFIDDRRNPKQPMLVADASGNIRPSGSNAGLMTLASVTPPADAPRPGRTAETKVAALPPQQLPTPPSPSPQLMAAPRMVERSSRLQPGPAGAPAPAAPAPAVPATTVAALSPTAKPTPQPAPAAAPAPVASRTPALTPAQTSPPPAAVASAAGPSRTDRSRLDELVTLAALEQPAPKLATEPRLAARRPAPAVASIAGTGATPPPPPMARPAEPAAPPKLAALEPAKAPTSVEQILSDAGFSTGWVPAPAFDEEHPEELSYRPFPVIPLLTDSSSADDPVLAHLSHPDVARTIEFIDDGGYIPPMRFRPGQQVAQVMWAQQFQGEAVSLTTMTAPDAGVMPSGLADRRVKTSAR